jgi:hypothetical protein
MFNCALGFSHIYKDSYVLILMDFDSPLSIGGMNPGTTYCKWLEDIEQGIR